MDNVDVFLVQWATWYWYSQGYTMIIVQPRYRAKSPLLACRGVVFEWLMVYSVRYGRMELGIVLNAVHV